MDPFTIFFIAVSAMAAAAQASAQASAQKAALEYNAAVARNSEIMAGYEKAAEAEKGVQDELDLRQKTRRLKGTQIAEMAAAGLDLSEGSAADILAGTDYMGEIDALRIRNDSARKQWAIGEKAKGYAAESNFLNTSASRISPTRVGGLALLQSGASSFASRYVPSSGGAAATKVAAAPKLYYA